MNRFLSFLFCVLAVATCKTPQTAESITPADEEFMREAILLSVESVTHGGGPFGSVIVKDGEIIASGSIPWSSGLATLTCASSPTATVRADIVKRNLCMVFNSYFTKIVKGNKKKRD